MYCYSKLSKMTWNGGPQQKEIKDTNTRIQPQHGRQQRTWAAANVVPAGRPRHRRRRGRLASVGVVEDVARLQTTGATSRRCLGRSRSTAEGGQSDLTSVPWTRRQRPSRHGGVVVSPGVAGQLCNAASLFPSWPATADDDVSVQRRLCPPVNSTRGRDSAWTSNSTSYHERPFSQTSTVELSELSDVRSSSDWKCARASQSSRFSYRIRMTSAKLQHEKQSLLLMRRTDAHETFYR